MSWGCDYEATESLPKPFQRLRTFTGVFLCDKAGKSRHDGKYHMYMDPRGDVEFAIGLPDWIKPMIESDKTRWAAGEYIRVDKTTGVHYVLGAEPKKVVELAASKFRAYGKAVEYMDSVEVIRVSFTGRGPILETDGTLKLPDEGKYRLRLESGLREHGRDIAINFSMERGFKSKEKNAKGEWSYYQPDDHGIMTRQYIGPDPGVFLPYNEENWKKLEAIQVVLIRAIDSLAELLQQDADTILARLMPGSLTLPAPEPKKAVVRRRR